MVVIGIIIFVIVAVGLVFLLDYFTTDKGFLVFSKIFRVVIYLCMPPIIYASLFVADKDVPFRWFQVREEIPAIVSIWMGAMIALYVLMLALDVRSWIVSKKSKL